MIKMLPLQLPFDNKQTLPGVSWKYIVKPGVSMEVKQAALVYAPEEVGHDLIFM